MLKRPETTINIDAILAVADYIEALPTNNDVPAVTYLHRSKTPVDFFSMRVAKSKFDCGTVACIKGVLHTLYDIEEDKSIFHTQERDAEFLGITKQQIMDLFMPKGWTCSDYTSQDAAKVLRHLALTGEVDWSIVESKNA